MNHHIEYMVNVTMRVEEGKLIDSVHHKALMRSLILTTNRGKNPLDITALAGNLALFSDIDEQVKMAPFQLIERTLVWEESGKRYRPLWLGRFKALHLVFLALEGNRAVLFNEAKEGGVDSIIGNYILSEAIV